MIQLMNPTKAYEKRAARIYADLLSHQYPVIAFDSRMREIHILMSKIRNRASDLGRGLEEFYEPVNEEENAQQEETTQAYTLEQEQG